MNDGLLPIAGEKSRLGLIIHRVYPLLVVSVLAAEMAAGGRNSPAKLNPPQNYYLALGDSITYGYQALKAQANLPPSAYNTGYVDAFATRLRQIRPNITVVNYGCPGESTDSFVNGPCPWTATGHQLHSAFSGTQLQAAIEFLRAYRGHVSPITLTLSGNDLPILLNPCTAGGQIDLSCVQANAPTFIAGLAERISGILRQLRLAAPDADIIVTGAWDSYVTMVTFADPYAGLVCYVLRTTAIHPTPVIRRWPT